MLSSSHKKTLNVLRTMLSYSQMIMLGVKDIVITQSDDNARC